MPSTEDRLTAAAGQTPRGPKSAGAQRNAAPPRAPQRTQARVVRDDVDDGRDFEDPEADDRVEPDSFEDEDRALALFLDSMQDNVLPDLPPLPGFHVCWLTTQNPRDPVARRLRAGYTLIRYEDIPGFDGASIKTGDYAGVIGINEMVAAKLPERAYQMAMRELHHNRPLGEESKIRHQVDSVKENAARAGARIVEEGDGTADLGKGAPAPRFS